jgi:ferredoxin
MVASCCYPVREGLEVRTDTPRVLRARRSVMELLLARAPESSSLRALAKSMGVSTSRLPSITRDENNCILCGLCVSVCRDVMEAAAISFANRGIERLVSTPFLQPSEACIGCGACAAVCPVGAIKIVYSEREVTISPFGTRLPTARCEICGGPMGALPFVEQVRASLGEAVAGATGICVTCRQQRAAARARQVSLLRAGASRRSRVPQRSLASGHEMTTAAV